MGTGLESVSTKMQVADVSVVLQTFNIDAQIVGRCEAHTGKKVTIKSEFGEFVYE